MHFNEKTIIRQSNGAFFVFIRQCVLFQLLSISYCCKNLFKIKQKRQQQQKLTFIFQSTQFLLGLSLHNAWLCNCMVNLFLYAIILRASYMKRKTFETILRNFHAMPFYTQKLQLKLNYHKHKILGDIEQSWRHQDQTSLLM